MHTLLIGVQGLLEEVVAGKDHDDGEVLINQGQDTVLELPRHDSLAVKVGNLLDLQGTFQGSRVLATTAEQKQGLLVLEGPLAQLLDGLVELQDGLDLLRDLAETLHNLLASLDLGGTVLAERQSEHDHGNELRSVGLGRGNTNFGAGVDVDTTVGEERDGRTDNVDNTNGQGATLQAVTESHQRIGSLTRLGNKHAGVVTENRGLSVQEIRGQLDRDGDLAKLLKDTSHSHARMITSSTSNEDDTSASTDRGDVGAETTQGDSPVLDVQTTTHSVDDGLGLLKDLLLHEVVELALHDLLELKLEGLDVTDIGSAVGLLETVDVEGALVDVGNIVILQVHDLLGVLDNSRGIRREEELGGHGHAIVGHEGTRLGTVQERLVRGAQKVVVGRQELAGGLLESGILRSSLGGEGTLFRVLDIDKVDLHALLGLDTDNKGRTLASSNNLMGVVNRLEEQTIGTLELGNNCLGQVDKVDGWVLVVQVLGQLGNALGIRLGLEAEALGAKEGPQLLVVGDDTVVDDGELPIRIGAARGKVG